MRTMPGVQISKISKEQEEISLFSHFTALSCQAGSCEYPYKGSVCRLSLLFPGVIQPFLLLHLSTGPGLLTLCKAPTVPWPV